MRSYVGEVGIGISPELKKRVREADLHPRGRPAPGRDDHGRLHAARHSAAQRSAWCTCIPASRSWAASTQAELMINAGMAEFAAQAARLGGAGRRSRGASWTRASAQRVSEDARAGAHAGRAQSERGRSPGCASVCRPGASSPTAPATSPAGCSASTSTPASALSSAPTNGAMGYGVPAAIAAKLVASRAHGRVLLRRRRLPDDRSGAGDRGAVRRSGDLHRRQQRHVRHHPHAPGARLSGARARRRRCSNPDFAALARAYGAHGELVERTEDFAPAFERAAAAGKPAVIEMRIDPEAITTRTTLSARSASRR